MNMVDENPRPLRRRHAQRGMSLIEALVAVVVFTVVFLTALALYQTANRAYMRTDAATIQQQNSRFAMDRLTEVLRDAGASHNPLGSRKLADEQVEGTWESAIFVRGDFDNSREQSPMLESTTFPIVTIGNDEIVGFVLRKPGANDQQITIKADFSAPRDAIWTSDASIAGEESKTIDVAALTLADQTDPPYQLTKVTFNAAGDPQYEVIADNVFRLSFKYYPATGVTASAAAGSADAERGLRKLVRRIEVSLIGMTDRKDFGYTDPTVYTPAETAETKSYRKLSLSQRIYASNLGRRGGIHYDVPAFTLTASPSITACNGHCRRYLISWSASPSGGVTTYKLEISAPADAGAGLAAYLNTETVEGLEFQFDEPQADVTAGVFRSWSFRVAPTSSVGTGAYTGVVTRVSSNVAAESTPSTPQNVSGTQAAAGVNAMGVTWDEVTTNTGTVPATRCISSDGSSTTPPTFSTSWNVTPVDLTNYKVFRVRSTGSNNGDAATVDVSSQELGELQNTPASATCETCEALLSFTDHTAAPCTPYFYRVKACDLCTLESTFSTAMGAAASFPPATGVTPGKASAPPSPVGAVNDNGTTITATLAWPAITRDSTGATAATAKYILERWWKPESAPDTSYVYLDETVHYETLQSGVITGATQDAGVDVDYRFYVRGVYECDLANGGPRVGPLSDPYDLKCTPDPATHTMTISEPAGATFIRPVDTALPLQVTVTGSGWTGSTIVVKDGDTVLHSETITGAPNGSNQYNFADYDVSDLDNGTYTVSATVKKGTCTGYAPDTTFELETVVCGVKMTSAGATLSPTTGANADRRKKLSFRLEATCPTLSSAVAIDIDALSLIWSNVPEGLTANITTIAYNGVNIVTGLTATTGANTTLIPLGQVITVPATGTSGEFTITYNRRMSLGSGASDARATWSSIAARNQDTNVIDETLESGSITPNN